jgi:hypothetical protein
VTESHPELNPSAPASLPEPSEADLIGAAVADRLGPVLVKLGQMFPQVLNMLPAMIAQAVQQAQPHRWCAPCVTHRLQWEAAHVGEMDTASAAAAEAAGFAKGDPRAAQLDVTPFLPAHLRSGSGHIEQMPQINDRVTTAGGNDVCPQHIPGVPGTQERRALLIPPPGMPVSMAAALAGRAS